MVLIPFSVQSLQQVVAKVVVTLPQTVMVPPVVPVVEVPDLVVLEQVAQAILHQ